MTRAIRATVGLLSVGALALLLGTWGCSRAPDPWEKVPGSPRVVVTIAPLYSFVRGVAGDRAAVICLCKDRGPHHFQYDVREAVVLQNADVFFAVGLTLDDSFADKMAKLGQRPELQYVRLGNSIKPKLIALKEKVKHGDHWHEGHDPHAWLGVDEAIAMVEVVRDTLVKADGANGADYTKNAKDYIERLKKLKEEGRARIAKGKHKRIITHHDSLRYFARCFGVEIAGVIERDPGAEPSGNHLAALVNKCVEALKEGRPITAIAVEPQYPKNTSAKTLQEEIEKKGGGTLPLIEIDPLETASGEELEKMGAGWYEKKMRQNIATLAEGQP
jgi:zinc transport system substrate-binding protein